MSSDAPLGSGLSAAGWYRAARPSLRQPALVPPRGSCSGRLRHRSDGGDLGDLRTLSLAEASCDFGGGDQILCRELHVAACGCLCPVVRAQPHRDPLSGIVLGCEDHFGVSKLCLAIGCTLCGAVFAKGMPSTSTVLAGQGCL